ncbi:MAG: hypothetical protein PWQ63_1682 [Methanolobus sp.]|jgi:predicted DNA-binding protein YlxM (UPF0122 family)|nr:hypothetical protein [Methanolobus sp.]
MLKTILKKLLTERQWQYLQAYLHEHMPDWETQLIMEENKAIVVHELTLGTLIKKIKGVTNGKQ